MLHSPRQRARSVAERRKSRDEGDALLTGHQLRRHGRTILTAEVAVLVQLASVGADAPVRTALAVAGALATAVVSIYESERGHKREETAAAAAVEHAVRAQRDAMERLADAARTFRGELANGMPLGGTTVPDGTTTERLVLMAEQLRTGSFTFLPGRRWSDWAGLGIALKKGRQEILAAAGLTSGRLPDDESQRLRTFVDLVATASRHASAIASAYAGYDVTEEPKLPRYMPEDRAIDVAPMAEYAMFASEFTSILGELDRMASLDGPA
jgi:hypothetical protein